MRTSSGWQTGNGSGQGVAGIRAATRGTRQTGRPAGRQTDGRREQAAEKETAEERGKRVSGHEGIRA